METFSLYEIVT